MSRSMTSSMFSPSMTVLRLSQLYTVAVLTCRNAAAAAGVVPVSSSLAFSSRINALYLSLMAFPHPPICKTP